MMAVGAALSLGQLPASAVTGALEFYRFDCVEETNEVGSDSPYFLVFTASGTNADTDQLAMVRHSSWDDEVDTGNIYRPRAAIPTTRPISNNSFVLVAVVEEDAGTDLESADVTSIRNLMHNAYQNSFWMPPATRVSSMRAAFAESVGRYMVNDDYLGSALVPMGGTTIPAVEVAGDGGRYRMYFRTA
ncbi:hypothetical protein [Streptomyces sp. SID13031]|uniref:hypothetical protein n=1 Tax=Streptomyces sp. SID13031 TaxID=2706046 RepID=UPI0013CC69E5|nr:hypothetical protein [Streptomyces sp. SID13031]NEA36872.1 hypothetical protein [Streptomyces sp. SID13031]